MSLFFNKDKTLKSPLLLSCFCLGLVYHLIYGSMYAILTNPLYRYVQLVNGEFSTALHAVLIALAGTAICCIFFALRDKRIVPGAFIFLAVSLLCGYLMTFHLGTDQRGLMRHLLMLYGLGPVLIGNAVSWGVYMRIRKRKGRRISADYSLQQSGRGIGR